MSALSNADSSWCRSSGSTGRSPVRICSTFAESSVFVLLTESFRRSRSVGSGGPKRVIMCSPRVAETNILAEIRGHTGAGEGALNLYAGGPETRPLPTQPGPGRRHGFRRHDPQEER